jgi:hypothetical protein
MDFLAIGAILGGVYLLQMGRRSEQQTALSLFAGRPRSNMCLRPRK